MPRDTRANVLFLLIFLALTLPGAIILFKKKLDPGARRMNMPDPAPKRLAYTGVQIIDNAPPALRKWFDELCISKTGAPALTRDGRAVASDNNQAQLIAASPNRIHLVLWSESARDIGIIRGATLVSTDYVSIPKLAITEMVQSAFAAPPGQIIWLTATDPASSTITLHYRQGNTPSHTSVNLFTNPAPTTK